LLQSFLVYLTIVLLFTVFNIVICISFLTIRIVCVFMLFFIRSDHHVFFFAIKIAVLGPTLGVLWP